ncbi:uncharacterized protein [Aristolochia californica]|uniref:uncharacterized protein isoform X2 n=1 Tax=Aristolochia californica TaxID=171875 RepID=UPI0035D57DC5
MEIDEAVKQTRNRRLRTKYDNAIYVIQRALALYAFEEVAFSFNGGKDSTVLLHLLRAGYYLHKERTQTSNGIRMSNKSGCPIRTIYFESPLAFPEINSFTYETASTYNLPLEIIRLDFKAGLEALLNEKPIKAIFLGTRIGDPNAVGQEQFSPSSPGWPPFMRVNPILDWSYRDVWAFLLTCKVRYCSLYDQGYTSIGSIYDTVPNSLLCIGDSSNIKENFRPAYLLADGRLEKAGRAKRIAPLGDNFVGNGLKSMESCHSGTLTAAIIAVGDEILLGAVKEHFPSSLCRKLQVIGWAITHIAVVQNDIDAVADEVELRKSTNDMVFMFGGLGPLHSDVTVAGVAKAFGVRLAPHEEFEEYLTHLMGEQCTGDRNEMTQLPEGVTELLHHQTLSVPLIKCQNVVILSATNMSELEKEWNCLLELTCSSGPLVLMAPFITKDLSTTLSDVKISRTLSEFCLEFPDLYIGCYRKSRTGPLIVSFQGKDEARIDLARQKLRQKFGLDIFSEVKSG